MKRFPPDAEEPSRSISHVICANLYPCIRAVETALKRLTKAIGWKVGQHVVPAAATGRAPLSLLPNLGVADFHSIVPDLPFAGHFVSCGRRGSPAACSCSQRCELRGLCGRAHTHTHSLQSARPLPLSRSPIQDTAPPPPPSLCCKDEPRPSGMKPKGIRAFLLKTKPKPVPEGQGWAKRNSRVLQDWSEVEFCAGKDWNESSLAPTGERLFSRTLSFVVLWSAAAAAYSQAHHVRKPVSLGLLTGIMDGSSYTGNHTSVGKYPMALALLKERWSHNRVLIIRVDTWATVTLQIIQLANDLICGTVIVFLLQYWCRHPSVLYVGWVSELWKVKKKVQVDGINNMEKQ